MSLRLAGDESAVGGGLDLGRVLDQAREAVAEALDGATKTGHIVCSRHRNKKDLTRQGASTKLPFVAMSNHKESAVRMRKKSYEAPRLVVYGKLKEITKESNGGSRLDNDFSAGTSSSDLTFS